MMNLLENSQYFSRKRIRVRWSSFAVKTHNHDNFTMTDQEKHKIKQIYNNPMTTGFIM